jgi:hypothetical protein
MAIIRFECKFEVIAQKIRYLPIYIPDFVWSNNNFKCKIIGTSLPYKTHLRYKYTRTQQAVPAVLTSFKAKNILTTF